MAVILFLAFLIVPIIEIAVFIQVGEEIGLWSTIGIVILTAIMGSALLRQQGISVLFRIQENINANRIPLRELFDGVCLVIAGALLLTPGFVTDAVGFLLFVPPVRAAIAAWLGKRIVSRAQVYSTHSQGPGPGQRPGYGPHGGGRSSGGGPGDVIDGEFEDITEEGPTDRQGGPTNTKPTLPSGSNTTPNNKPDT